MPPFMPVMTFAILFGLSMDYEVLLLSRVREQYLFDGRTDRARRDGLAKTARVITAAAAIIPVDQGHLAEKVTGRKGDWPTAGVRALPERMT